MKSYYDYTKSGAVVHTIHAETLVQADSLLKQKHGVDPLDFGLHIRHDPEEWKNAAPPTR